MEKAKNQKKTIVYDFDKTLTEKDTVKGFLRMFHPNNILVTEIIYSALEIICWLGIISNMRLKDLGLLLFIKEETESKIDSVSDCYAKSIKFSKLMTRVQSHTDANVFVVTASFECYVKKCFASEINVIGAKIEKRNGWNRIKQSCHGIEKVQALKSIGVEKIDEFYTDSRSDLPLARIAKSVFLVKQDRVIPIKNLRDLK